MRCAVYARVSTDKDEQKLSLQNQQQMFFEYICEKGWDLAKIYLDVESGTTEKRKGLQELILDAKKGKFDVILAKELSRLARNGKLSYEIKDLAQQLRIHIITLDGAINTLDGNGHMFGLYAWMYEQESQRTSERVKASIRTRSANGLFKGSIAPYGYEVQNGKLVPRNDGTPFIVKRIFREYLEGHGTDSIARRLFKEGFPTPSQIAGKRNASIKWHGSTIKEILTNPHYIGDLVQGRETTCSVTTKRRDSLPTDKLIIVNGTHEPLISKEEFDTVQAQMKIRKRNITAPKKHLFTNVAYCADCGTGMWYRQNRKGYICGGYARHGQKFCSNHAVEEKKIIQAILNDLNHFIKSVSEDDVNLRIEKKNQNAMKRASHQILNIERELEHLRNEKNRLIKLLANEIITQDDYQEVVQSNNKRIKDLLTQKQQLENLKNNNMINEKLSVLLKELNEPLTQQSFTPDFLHRFVNRIEIEADGVLRIHYSFSSPSAIL